MQTEKIYGFTRGIVIKNNDPHMRGRVKIFIPAYPALSLDKSYNLSKPGRDFIEASKTSSMVNFPKSIMDEIAEIVPWADQASPLMGSGGMGLYNAKKDRYQNTDISPISANVETPAKKAAKTSSKQTPSTVSSSGTPAALSKMGAPTNIHNSARGSFSVPKVGSHVWVFFEDGNITRPIYFAYSYNNNEWESVLNGSSTHPSVHSPSRVPLESDKDSPVLYAGKYTLTERGGTLEITNTQGFEAVKISDFHGNTYQLTNLGIFENTAHGKPKTSHITGDYFLKVDGRYKVEVNGDMEIVSKGTKHHIVGNLEDKKIQDKWISNATEAFKNAAKFKKAPDFTSIKEKMVKSAEKKAPNDFFCLPKFLNFKLPFGIPLTLYLKKLNMMLFAIKDYFKIAILVIKNVQELTDEILKIIRNPFSFIFALIGDPLKLLGITLCNNKDKK
jgi:hypothetical protein